MEFLEGEDLEKRLARVGRLSAPAAIHIIRQVASALSATHAKGIVHRDLKPANVFLLSVEGETDFVKVVDFGISKVRAAGTKLTAALAVMGTPNYMAPEQAEGRIDEIDHRTDQWALACIAYELVGGTAAVRRRERRVAAVPGDPPGAVAPGQHESGAAEPGRGRAAARALQDADWALLHA